MSRAKWIALGALVAGGGMLFQSGCLGAFWQGLSGSGFPTDSRWLNLAVDVANQMVFG